MKITLQEVDIDQLSNFNGTKYILNKEKGQESKFSTPTSKNS